MPNPIPQPELRLIFQGSIPITCQENGEAEYNDLKTHLLAISPRITLSGQIIKQLEPCCAENTKTQLPRGVLNYPPVPERRS